MLDDQEAVVSAERYIYERGQLQMVLDDEELAGEGRAALKNRYFHGPAIDEVLNEETFEVGQTDPPSEKYWTVLDHQNTARAFAEFEYDSGPETTVVAEMEYDAFGNTLSETGSIDHRFGFAGRDWDADAALYYNRARWYDPLVGRFVSEDPLGFAAGDENLYRYVGASPVMYVDPSGCTSPVPSPEGDSRSTPPTAVQGPAVQIQMGGS